MAAIDDRLLLLYGLRNVLAHLVHRILGHNTK
jgi:hypothetical protein